MKESKQALIEFLGVKAVAVPVLDEDRAKQFYGEVLGLPPADEEDDLPLGYQLGDTILLLKPDWYAAPSTEPSPRITLEVADARSAERALKTKGVSIADAVTSDGNGYVGSFLDSEGNKLWFCSYV